MVGFIFGGNTGDSYESLQRRRQVADRFAAQLMANKPKTALEGVAAVLAGLGGSINRGRIDDAENAGTDKAKSFADAILSGSPLGGASTASQVSATSPNQTYTTAGGGATQSAGPINMDGNQIYSGFIDTVKQGGLTNPYGLAAVAATGKAESGFSPQNANRSWSDPSQSGQAGSAGGIMSWRADRLKNLYGYASSKGEKPGAISPQTQAEFFLREDPTLIQKLNAAKSPEEAQSMMNRAWAFAGYDKPGGESARRLSYANSFLPTFQGNQQAQARPQQQAPQAPQEVASLDPSVGMSGAGSEMMRTNPAPQARAAAPSIAAPNIPIPTPRPQMQAPDVSGPAPQSEGPSVEVAGGGGRPSSYAQPQAPQGNGVDPRILQALANPFTPPEMKQSLQMLAQQQMQQAQQQQEQQVWMQRQQQEQQTWTQRQQFEQQAQQADPLYQQRLQASQREMENYQSPQQQEEAWRARQQFEQQQRQADPAYSLDLDAKRAQIEALKAKPQRQWQRLDDNTLYNPENGETRNVPVDPNAAPSELGLNPQYGVDAQGNPVLLQLGKDGRTIQSKLPEGVTLSKEPIKLDAGTHFVLLDPITRQPVGQIPKENRQEAAEKAAGTVEGDTKAKLSASAPGDFQAAQNALDLIDSIRTDPSRGRGTGMTSMLNSIPGTGGFDFQQKVEQAKGGAFLTAIQQMRGLGALSNTEGSAATSAVTRMNTSATEDGFLSALSDYEKIVKQGMERAKVRLPADQRPPSLVALPPPAAVLPMGENGVPDLSKMSDDQLRELLRGQ